VAGCSLATVHDLFLSQGNERRAAAELLLMRLTQQSESLLMFCGEQLRRHGPAVADMPVTARRAAVLAATIIAMCLYKLNRNKEEYMQQPAFLLGRFLALADLLHEQYCRVVRKGDVPPQLLGYQHFAMAADNAQVALSVLHSRFGVYYQWARTAKASPDNQDAIKSFRIARWARSRLGETAEQLTGRLPDGPLNDAQRAEMLLGYLARVERVSSENGDQTSGAENEEILNA
jgi:hypothetical protein